MNAFDAPPSGRRVPAERAGVPARHRGDDATGRSAFEQALRDAESAKAPSSSPPGAQAPDSTAKPSRSPLAARRPGGDALPGDVPLEAAAPTGTPDAEQGHGQAKDGIARHRGPARCTGDTARATARTAAQANRAEPQEAGMAAEPGCAPSLAPPPTFMPMPSAGFDSAPACAPAQTSPVAGSWSRAVAAVPVLDAPAGLPPPASVGDDEWRLELQDPALPIQGISLERLDGGALKATLQVRAPIDAALPGSSGASQVIEASVRRLRQRLAQKGVVVDDAPAAGSDDEWGSEATGLGAPGGKSARPRGARR